MGRLGRFGRVYAALAVAAAAVAVAVVVVKRRRKGGKWGKVREILAEIEKKCATPAATLRQVADAMAVEMHAGLASDGGSKLKMLLSYVDNLPTG
jgi:hexokinase